jgi:phage-related protein
METLVWDTPRVESSGQTETANRITNHFVADATVEAPDGIFPNALAYSGVWVNTPADADTLVAFFRRNNGKTFIWTMPRETSPRYWQCKGWTRSAMQADRDTIQASFEERIQR